jgi:hypothetical protein
MARPYPVPHRAVWSRLSRRGHSGCVLSAPLRERQEGFWGGSMRSPLGGNQDEVPKALWSGKLGTSLLCGSSLWGWTLYLCGPGGKWINPPIQGEGGGQGRCRGGAVLHHGRVCRGEAGWARVALTMNLGLWGTPSFELMGFPGLQSRTGGQGHSGGNSDTLWWRGAMAGTDTAQRWGTWVFLCPSSLTSLPPSLPLFLPLSLLPFLFLRQGLPVSLKQASNL